MSTTICLATNYLLMTEPTRRMWEDMGARLNEVGCQLVLLSTTVPEVARSYHLIPIPYLFRDYAQQFPAAVTLGGCVTPRDFDLIENDRSRTQGAGSAHEGLAGLIACRQVARNLINTLQPGCVLAWDPSSPLATVLREPCLEREIPFTGIERGLLPDTLMMESRGLHAWSDLRTHWLAQDLPASARDLSAFERIRDYYLKARPQKYEHPDFEGGGAALRTKLELGSKKVVVVLGQFDSCGLQPRNSPGRRYHSPEFVSTQDALMGVWAHVENDPSVAVVFKPHPIDQDPYAVAKVEGVQVVRDVNPHALIDLADVVVAQFTTLQFEAALYDKPVVLLGHSAWWGRNAAYEVDRREQLPAVLRAALRREGWEEKRANARAFLTWIMDQFLIGCTPDVPARRNLRDLAQFIARIAADGRHLPPVADRLAAVEAALNELRARPPN